MKTLFLNIAGVLIAFVIIKMILFFEKKKREKVIQKRKEDFAKELPKLMENMKKRAEQEVKLQLFFYSLPILIKKSLETLETFEKKKQIDNDKCSENCT